MTRLRSALLAIATAVVLTLAATATPAYAFPTTPFDNGDAHWVGDPVVFGSTNGSFIWYNRSVGVQGQVCNGDLYATPWTQVEFDFYHNNTPVPPDQTRTTSSGCRSFNFTQGGPVGGINRIVVWLRDGFGYEQLGIYTRP